MGAAALCEADMVVVCVDMAGLAAVAREDPEVGRRFTGTAAQVKHAAWRSLQCAHELLAMLSALRRSCKRPLARLPTLLLWHSPAEAVRAARALETAAPTATSEPGSPPSCSYSELLSQLSETYEVDALLQVGGWGARSDGGALYAGAGVAAALAVGALLGQWRRVLVVDDSAFNVRLVARFLYQFPAVAVTTALHGRHCLLLALERGRRRQPAGLLYTDLNMPGMAGHELADRIRALPFEGAAEVKVVAVTGSTTAEDKRRVERHMESFLAKVRGGGGGWSGMGEGCPPSRAPSPAHRHRTRAGAAEPVHAAAGRGADGVRGGEGFAWCAGVSVTMPKYHSIDHRLLAWRVLESCGLNMQTSRAVALLAALFLVACTALWIFWHAAPASLPRLGVPHVAMDADLNEFAASSSVQIRDILAVGTRYWARDRADHARLVAFVGRALEFADLVLVGIRVEKDSANTVQAMRQRYSGDERVLVFAISPWLFYSANINALVATAARLGARYLLLQSIEVVAPVAAVRVSRGVPHS